MCSTVCEVGVCVQPGWGEKPEGGGVYVLLCVVLAATQARLWFECHSQRRRRLGRFQQSRLVLKGLDDGCGNGTSLPGRQGSWFPLSPWEQAEVSQAVWERRDAQGWRTGCPGSSLGGAREGGRSGCLGGIRRKGLENRDKAFLQHLALFIS